MFDRRNDEAGGGDRSQRDPGDDRCHSTAVRPRRVLRYLRQPHDRQHLHCHRAANHAPDHGPLLRFVRCTSSFVVRNHKIN